MKRLFATFLSLLLTLPCGATETLHLSTAADLNESISAVVLAEAYRRLGIEVQAQQNPSFQSLALVNSGKIDGEISRAAGFEALYPNLVRVPVPVHKFYFAVFASSVEFELAEPTWENLRPYSIGIKQGSDDLLRRLAGMDTVQVVSHEKMFRQLSRGKFDVCVSGQRHGQKIIDELGLDNVTLLKPVLEELPIYHYLHKKHQRLIPELARVLRQMTEEGFLAQVHLEFLGNTGHFSRENSR